MRTLAIILSLAIGIIPCTGQRTYLVKKLSNNARESDYTWLIPGQPIGIRSPEINLNFEQITRASRFLRIQGDTLVVRRIKTFRDTIVTWNKRDQSQPELFRACWEHGGMISRHRRIITTRYQIAVEVDTLLIPVATINRIRTNRRSVQALSESGMEFGALLPPVFAYLFFINKHPARNYSLKKWRLMQSVPFDEV